MNYNTNSILNYKLNTFDDILKYVIILYATTFILCSYKFVIFIYLTIFIILLCLRLENTYDIGMSNWFTISKFIGSLTGVFIISYVIYKKFVNIFYYNFINLILSVNIFEATLLDYKEGYNNNSLCGFILILTIPFNFNDSSVMYIEDDTLKYHLDQEWIFLYTLWNFLFSYENNFAISTRIILTIPIIYSSMYGFENWLFYRSMSLFVHMTMRFLNITRFYKPGETVITPRVGIIKHDSILAIKFGVFNIFIHCIYVLQIIFKKLNNM